MRRLNELLVAVALSFGLLCAAALGQVLVTTRPTPYNGPQYCQITNLAAATSFVTASCSTGSIRTDTKIAQICVGTAAVRYTSNGPTPTASIGIPVAVGVCFQYSGTFSTLQFIQQASGAILDIETFP